MTIESVSMHNKWGIIVVCKKFGTNYAAYIDAIACFDNGEGSSAK